MAPIRDEKYDVLSRKLESFHNKVAQKQGEERQVHYLSSGPRKRLMEKIRRLLNI